jgi:crotonobetainyl-CoA:carnitine CoA-transferase CaiB-like acyl-CoA transferase
MRAARVPVAPIRDLEEVRTDPHLRERGMLRQMSHPDMGEIVLPSSPIRFSGYEPSDIEFYPEVGAHNEEIYGAWLGLGATELAELAADEVI